jgi:hypothetical protein
MTSRRSRRAPRWLRGGVLAIGMSLLTSGCFLTVATDHRAASPNTRPYYCNAVGDGTPIGGHGNGSHVHPIYEGMTKGKLSWDDCFELGRQLDSELRSVWGLWTREAGEAAGWREIAEYIPGLGTHHVRGDFLPRPDDPESPDDPEAPPDPEDPVEPTPRPFDPARPTFLIYGGEGPEAPLVGVAYAASGTRNPPEAFAGTNDWWHLHQKICLGPGGRILAGAEEIPDEECTALGGTNRSLGSGIWLLHVWMVPNYAYMPDIFSSGYPCLGETGPLPRTDACWNIVNHDPADGPPPGSDHGGGGHGGHDAHGGG